MNTETIACYHGGQHSDPKWFTTCETHAWAFGDARPYSVSGDALRVHADDITADGGFDADADAYEYLERSGADMLIIDGWEGGDLCILVSDMADVEAA